MTNVGRRDVLRAGAVGLASAGFSGAVTAQSDEVRPDFDGYIDDADGGFLDARGQDEVAVTVGAEGNGGFYAFEPAGLWIDPGTTVVWEWTGEGGQHNVVAEDGSIESELTQEQGFTFEHTFEDTGITQYYCAPHKALEMKGAIAVGDDVPTIEPGAGGGGGGGDQGGFPITFAGDDVQRAIGGIVLGFLGLAVAALLGAEGYASYRDRRMGSGTAEAAAAAADVAEGESADVTGVESGETPEYTEEAPEPEPVTEIGHDDYDPTGTATLIAIYLTIVVLMWLFMYFVEFLGNGPTVIG